MMTYGLLSELVYYYFALNEIRLRKSKFQFISRRANCYFLRFILILPFCSWSHWKRMTPMTERGEVIHVENFLRPICCFKSLALVNFDVTWVRCCRLSWTSSLTEWIVIKFYHPLYASRLSLAIHLCLAWKLNASFSSLLMKFWFLEKISLTFG